MELKTIQQKLIEIQNKIRVTKDKNNDFGKYKYRSAEMIYEEAKPLCMERGLLLTVSDDIVMMGERYYIKATATLTDGKESITNSAYAREADQMKGQADPQVSGSTSSYARKYALQGLFLLDDNKDPDEMENGGKVDKPKANSKSMTVVEKKVEEMFKLASIKKQDIGKIKMSIVNKYNKTNLSELTEEEIEPIMTWLRGI